MLSFTYAATHSALGTASILILTTLVRLVAGFVTVQVIDRLPHRTLMIGSGPTSSARSSAALWLHWRRAGSVGAGLYGVVAVLAALSVPIRTYKLSSTAA